MIQLITSRPITISLEQRVLLHLLRNNPHAHTAYFEPNSTNPTVTLETEEPNISQPQTAITHIGPISLNWKKNPHPKNLLLTLPSTQATHGDPNCYPAPVPLGCQIQPNGKNWVGTAGAPIQFHDTLGYRHWGFITNAHVSAIPKNDRERRIHQPTDSKPHIGYTQIVAYPNPNSPNTLDVALIDSKIASKHTTAWEILQIGKPAPTWTNAAPGTKVMKYGRTTQLTHGNVTKTGVAAKINYGSFTATFIDLDLIENTQSPFSQPGDSGSIILTQNTKQPTALLFAGSTYTTLAIPIRNIAKNLKISFTPN